MSKIIAEKGVLEYCKKAAPGNKSVYVNMDAINELPDQFEVVLTEIKFNIKTDFSDVGSGNMMPATALMYRIAEAVGISGGDNSITEPVIEEVDINPMLLKPIEAEPTFRKMTVGRKVKKFSTLLQEDGTLRRSSPCTSVFNVWERCMELWTAEESNTKGYDASIVKHYPDGNGYYEYTWNKQVKKKSLKYDTSYKRRAHFNAELKFAHAKAETKSHTKTIRELAGLMTGYTDEDLKEGKFIFSKVRKSRDALKLEQAANLSRISNSGQASPAGNLLFSPEDEAENISDAPAEPKEEDVTPEPTKEEELLGIFQSYEKIETLPDAEKQTAAKCIRFLESNPARDDSYDRLYKKVVDGLRKVELKVDFDDKIDHKFC